MTLSYSTCPSLVPCCCNQTPQPKETRGGKDFLQLTGSSSSSREARAGAQGRTLEAGTDTKTAGRMLTALLPKACSATFFLQHGPTCLRMAPTAVCWGLQTKYQLRTCPHVIHGPGPT